MRLAVDLSGRPEHPALAVRAEHWVDLARLAESGALDFVVFDDSFVPPGGGPGEVGRLEAVAVAARVAPLTTTVGLVATATTTHTEPFHLSKALATLDFVSAGRAGWQPDISRTAEEAALFGRKDAAPVDALWREAAEAVDVVTRLWDSWEDDAVIRDVATGRYVDRDKLHHVDFRGEFFAVKGPSITPRPPQAHPPVVLRLPAGDEPAALALIGRWADVARVPSVDGGRAGAADPGVDGLAADGAGRVRAAVRAAGRDPEEVSVLLDVPIGPTDAAEAVVDRAAAALGVGLDGVVLVPETLPGGLRRAVQEVVPLLVGRGLRAPGPGRRTTLRERLGLARPANPYAGGFDATATAGPVGGTG